MIQSSLKPDGYQNWNDVPVSTKEEVMAKKASLTFSASTSLSEKIQRIFNGMMFLTTGANLLMIIPPFGAVGAALGGKIAVVLSGITLMEVPAILAIMAVAYKILAITALIVVVRKIAAVAINYLIYPASLFDKSTIDKQRWNLFDRLNQNKFECRRIALNKSGIDYDAFVVEHATTKNNGKWVIMAGGNGWVGESALGEYADSFSKLGLNIIFVNGPGVGRSSGFPTSYSIGAGQEAGLQFLEKVVEGTNILLYGASLGGGAQAEAILNHEFKKDLEYIVWGDRTFDYLSNAASHMVTKLAKPAFSVLGIELNGVAGAQKLQKLGITHIITQNSGDKEKQGILPLDGEIDEKGTDGVIPNAASLFVGLKKAGINDSNRLKCYGNKWIDHNGPLPGHIQRLAEADITYFLASVN